MTATGTTVEVVPIEGIDLDGTPRCEMFGAWVFRPNRRRQCRQRATHRVKVTCPMHGTSLRFLCKPHLRLLKRGRAGCWRCNLHNPALFAGEC